MAKQRFLRDNILDEMLEEIRNIVDKVSHNQFPSIIFSNSISAISEIYETQKRVLFHLEEAIDRLRMEDAHDEVIKKVVESAALVQLGLVNVHNALKRDVSSMADLLHQLEKSIKQEN